MLKTRVFGCRSLTAAPEGSASLQIGTAKPNAAMRTELPKVLPQSDPRYKPLQEQVAETLALARAQIARLDGVLARSREVLQKTEETLQHLRARRERDVELGRPSPRSLPPTTPKETPPHQRTAPRFDPRLSALTNLLLMRDSCLRSKVLQETNELLRHSRSSQAREAERRLEESPPHVKAPAREPGA